MVESLSSSNSFPSLIKAKLNSLEKSDWFNIATLITAVAFVTLAVLAYTHVGAFAHLGPAAKYLAYGFAGGFGAIILGQLIKSVISACKKKTPTNPLHVYANKNRSASQKLRYQLKQAVQEGEKGEKTFPKATFKVNLEEETDRSLIDTTYSTDTIGVAESKGLRPNMEDAHVTQRLNIDNHDVHLYGVFDGHGEDGVGAKYLEDNLPGLLTDRLSALKGLDEESVANALTKLCIELEQLVHESISEEVKKGENPWIFIEGGTTATCALTIDNKTYVFNVGDSRTVLVREKAVYQLSEDANPNSERFHGAVRKMGHEITEKLGVSGQLEVSGMLKNGYRGYIGVARDLGSELLPARPKITVIEKGIEDSMTAEDPEWGIGYSDGDYLVLACDGLWDVATNEEVFSAIHEMEEFGMKPNEMAARLITTAIEAESSDNVSVMVVKL